MINMEFAENWAVACRKMSDAGLAWNSDSLNSKTGISKFFQGTRLVGVYDEAISMVFFEVIND